MGEFAAAAMGGSMLLAIPVALVVGMVAFFSPCVLPLLPGYLSYATGMVVADVRTAPRGRLVAGTCGFIAGFSLVFLVTGVAASFLGVFLLQHADALTRVAGLVIVILGLGFAGALNLPNVSVLSRWSPPRGVLSSPVLGIVFGLGWTPCVGPALGVVLGMGYSEGTVGRGVVLSICYAVGLGLPFLGIALSMARVLSAVEWAKRHQRGLQLAGGAIMCAVGLLMVTGVWGLLTGYMRQFVAGWSSPI